MNPKKPFQKALNQPKDLAFRDLVNLASTFGFRLSRVRGSHHIFVHPDVDRPLNLQEVDGKAKPYPVRQFIRLVEENDLSLEEWSCKDYHINVLYSQKNAGYIADISDLRTCSAFGATPAEALAELERAKSAWLEAARVARKAIPIPLYRPAIYQVPAVDRQ